MKINNSTELIQLANTIWYCDSIDFHLNSINQ